MRHSKSIGHLTRWQDASVQAVKWRSTTLLKAVFSAVIIFAAASTYAQAGCRDLGRADEGTVVFYKDAECKGASHKFTMGANDGNYAQLPDGWNDEVSSIRVGKGVKATIYGDGNYEGARATLWPGHYSRLWIYHDEVSSLKLEKIAGDALTASFFEDTKDDDGAPNQMKHYLGAGEFNFDGNEEEFLLRQTASMIWMPKGLKVTLFGDYNGNGKALELSTPDAPKTFKLPAYGFNDMVKSVKVEVLPMDPALTKRLKSIDLNGQWVLINSCTGARCDSSEQSIEIGVEAGKEVSNETELGTALSVALGYSVTETAEASAGPGVSAGVEMTQSVEFTASMSAAHRKAIADSFSTSLTKTVTQSCSGAGSIYQWQSRLEYETLGDPGKLNHILAKSSIYVCPPPGMQPTDMKDINFIREVEDLTLDWKQCAYEHGECNLTDGHLVRYGASATDPKKYRQAYKVGSFNCHHSTEGLGPDPAHGIRKQCWYAQ
jgi:hypothetical protein